MKKIIFSTLLSLSTLLSTAGVGDTVIVGESQTMVYIVMSSTAHAYHCYRDCKGLRIATHEIKQVTVEDAVSRYGRKACGYCYK